MRYIEKRFKFLASTKSRLGLYLLQEKELTFLAIYIVIGVKTLKVIRRFKCCSRDPRKLSK